MDRSDLLLHLVKAKFGKAVNIDDHVGDVIGITDVKTEIRKMIKFIKIDPDYLDDIVRELYLSLVIANENSNLFPLEDVEIFETDDATFLAIIMQRAPATLSSWLRDLRTISKTDQPKQMLDVMYQITCGLAALHNIQVGHFDLKPDNIFLQNGEAFLADFGLSRSFNTRYNQIFPEKLGTMDWMAPELVAHPPAPLNPSADIWSLGIIFLQMLQSWVTERYSEFLPWYYDKKTLLPTVSNEAVKKLETWLVHASPQELFKLIHSRMAPQIINQVASSQLKGLLPLIQQMLLSDPEKRLTANEILGYFETKMNVPPNCPHLRITQMRKHTVPQLSLHEEKIIEKLEKQGADHIPPSLGKEWRTIQSQWATLNKRFKVADENSEAMLWLLIYLHWGDVGMRLGLKPHNPPELLQQIVSLIQGMKTDRIWSILIKDNPLWEILLR